MNSSRMLLKVAHCVYCAALGFADVVQGAVHGLLCFLVIDSQFTWTSEESRSHIVVK